MILAIYLKIFPISAQRIHMHFNKKRLLDFFEFYIDAKQVTKMLT